MERYLPYLMFLLCPLLHILLMRGHRHHGQNQAQTQNTEEKSCH